MRDPPHPPLVRSKSVLAAEKGPPLTVAMSSEESKPKPASIVRKSPPVSRQEEFNSVSLKAQSPSVSDSQRTLVGVQSKLPVGIEPQGDEPSPDGHLDAGVRERGEGQGLKRRRRTEEFDGEESPSLDLLGINGDVVTSESNSRSAFEESNARSAFEITSVVDATEGDEMETSVRQPSSADPDTISVHLKAGNDPLQTIPDVTLKKQLSASSSAGQLGSASTEDAATVLTNAIAPDARPPGPTHTSPLSSSSNSSLSSPSAMTQAVQPPPVSSQPPPTSGNGPLNQPGTKRFRRVNNYPRGRWSVADRSEPEQRPESQSSERGPLHSSSQKSLYGSPEMIGPSPITGRKSLLELSEDMPLLSHMTSQSGSDHGPAPSDTASERDPQEMLSRHGSLSSVVTTEKSADGDERLQDVETESVASASADAGTTGTGQDFAYPTSGLPTNGAVTSVPLGFLPAASSTTPPVAETRGTATGCDHDRDCTCEICSQ